MAEIKPKQKRTPGPGRPFSKGVSGNPGGRPIVSKDVQELARQHTPEAMRALLEALHDPRQKVAAACAILDRGYGRPTQAHTIDHNFSAAAARDEALAAIAFASSGVAALPQDDPAEFEAVVH